MEKEKIQHPIGLIAIFLYALWVIVPRFHYTISVVYIAVAMMVFLVMLCLTYAEFRAPFIILLFLCSGVALLYYLIAFPMNLKKAFLTFMEQFMLFVPSMLALYVHKRFSRIEKRLLTVGLGGFQLFVGTVTISALMDNPMISRLLTSSASEESRDIYYRLQNIGGYGTIYSFVFVGLLSVFLLLRLPHMYQKLLSLGAFTFCCLLLQWAQFGTSVVLLFVGILLYLILRNGVSLKKVMILVPLAVLVAFLPDLIRALATSLDGGVLQERLNAIASLIQNGETSDADLTLRIYYLQEGFFTFFHSPIWGNTIEENGVRLINLYSHSSYLDLACSTGLIGLALYIKATINAARMSAMTLIGDSRIAFYVEMTVFVLLGLVNPNWGIYEIGIILFLWIPLVLDLIPQKNDRPVKEATNAKLENRCQCTDDLFRARRRLPKDL